MCFSLLHLPLPPHGYLWFFGPPFNKTGNIPTLEEVLSAVLGHSFEFPLLTVSFSYPKWSSADKFSAAKEQLYSLFLSRASPLLPPRTQIIYPNIFPWEKTSQPESCDFQKAITDYLSAATRNASRKLVLLNTARAHTKISCWQD